MSINDIDVAIRNVLDNPPKDGVLLTSLNTFIDGCGGITRGFHKPEQCKGRGCPIHAPSDHGLRHLRLRYRYSDIGVEPIIAERVCDHGVGHPDPDWLTFIEERHGADKAAAESTHGCDGCCAAPDLDEDKLREARLIVEQAKVTAREDDKPFLDPPSLEDRLEGWEAKGDGEVTT